MCVYVNIYKSRERDEERHLNTQYTYIIGSFFIFICIQRKQRKTQICIIFASLRVFSFRPDLQDHIVHVAYNSKQNISRVLASFALVEHF